MGRSVLTTNLRSSSQLRSLTARNSELRRRATIQKASRTDWRAAAWLLERDLPEVYSLRYKVEHSVSGEQTLADALRALRSDAPGMKQIEGEKIEEAEQW